MRIAVSAEGPDVTAQLSHRFGMAPYLIIADTDKEDFEVVPNPGAEAKKGAGVQTVVVAINNNVNVVLTGYASPVIKKHFQDAGIELVTGLGGTVGQVIERYKKGELGRNERKASQVNEAAITASFFVTVKQFFSLLPMMIAVVLLIGLFTAFVSGEALASIFSGNDWLDTLWGACFGSILAGNPISSYIIGGELMEQGISMFAITALIVSWVTVGLVQLPAEITALGRKYALLRNFICFVFAIPVAMLTVFLLNLFTR